MHREIHTLLCSPLDDLVIPILLRLGGFVVVVHIPRNALADAVELQHVVAKAHGKHPRKILQLIEFGARGLSIQSESNSNRHLAVAPDFEYGGVVRRCEIISAGIDESGHAESVQFSKESLRAVDFFLRCWFWKSVEQIDDCVLTADNRARRFAVRSFLKSASGRQ